MSDKCFETLELITITYQGKFPTLVYNVCVFKLLFQARSEELYACSLQMQRWRIFGLIFHAAEKISRQRETTSENPSELHLQEGVNGV